jgi:hypothetical protein
MATNPRSNTRIRDEDETLPKTVKQSPMCLQFLFRGRRAQNVDTGPWATARTRKRCPNEGARTQKGQKVKRAVDRRVKSSRSVTRKRRHPSVCGVRRHKRLSSEQHSSIRQRSVGEEAEAGTDGGKTASGEDQIPTTQDATTQSTATPTETCAGTQQSKSVLLRMGRTGATCVPSSAKNTERSLRTNRPSDVRNAP